MVQTPRRLDGAKGPARSARPLPLLLRPRCPVVACRV